MLEPSFAVSPLYSLAFHQNQFPLISELQLKNESDETSYSDIEIVIEANPAFFSKTSWRLAELKPGQRVGLADRPLPIVVDSLDGLTEETLTTIVVSIFADGEELQSINAQSRFMPKNYWAGESKMPELLAAFVTPNSPFVESLVVESAQLLKDTQAGLAVNGYQSESRESPYMMASALWSVLRSKELLYINPAPSFASQGQRVVMAEDIAGSRSGACLDLSLLVASCLERMGLNTLVLLTEGHAFVGVWLIDSCFQFLTTDDPIDIRKRVSQQDVLLFETTLLCDSSNVTFSQSCDAANRHIEEEKEDRFVYAIDIKQARNRKIRVLPSRHEKDSEELEKAETTGPQLVPPPPPLPPVKRESIAVEDTPESRVDHWQRRLLDLTKRNRLLNLASNAIAVKIFCPNLERLEDMLAGGQVFSFLAPDESSVFESSRSSDIYRIETGNDLQKEFALEQLERNILVSHLNKSTLDKQLLSLFRKSKTDLEEGGSNTLFLSIGMLRWKEDEKFDKSYRAPLILYPVELTRASAKSKVRLRHLTDEEPIFNSTLIEFLEQDYQIDLSFLTGELPEDESGIDVGLIWSEVRAKIADVPGFELIEDLVLSNFSFAKYLMWKDLRDRLEDLKSNLFVDHLIEKPQETYSQDSRFIDIQYIDKEIKPSEIFAPLNADSSQLIAIEASAHTQDFVLEGPPGTGKSETIANIICHNLAVGRKVLFVAEKMAALNVVYRRLVKVGLSHLCLELHSNKANKAAVLEQLRDAWTSRQDVAAGDWEEKADNLLQVRNKLNHYVDELHKKSVFGVSARDCISRAIMYADIHDVDLVWKGELAAAPVRNQSDLGAMLDTSRDLGLAYSNLDGEEVNSLKLISNDDWSNSWQASLLEASSKLSVALQRAKHADEQLLSELGLECPQEKSLQSLLTAGSAATCVEALLDRPLDLAFGGRVRDALSLFDDLEEANEEIADALVEAKSEVKASAFLELPVKEWSEQKQIAEESFWPLSSIRKFSIRRKLKKSGVGERENLSIIDTIRSVQTKCNDLAERAKELEKASLWKGWDSSTSELKESKELLSSYSGTFRKLLSENDIDLAEGLSVLRKLLSEQWDFLDSNQPLLDAVRNTKDAAEELTSALDVFATIAKKPVELSSSISSFEPSLAKVVEAAPRINAWCNWLETRKNASRFHLDNFADQLELGRIDHASIQDYVHTAFCRWVAPRLIDQSEVLRKFSVTSHEALIEDFKQLDALVSKTTADFIVAKTAAEVPSVEDAKSSQELGALSRELAKKARHKPVRLLIDEMGSSLLGLTPCLMMSPLSVAQFLPSTFNDFDLVLFDEASQITVWDAVGAIARGKNCIVVGDPKQMPPTNFFSRGASDDDEEDLESILDQAIAARLPHRRLTGHYRSRHESLIAFSNSHYYGNSLITYPSAETKSSAVSFHKVDGVYSKGKGRNNPIEAREVAKEVVRRLQDPELSHLSIGIVALNSEQQRTIEDELDNHRRSNPALEPFFVGNDEIDPVFVKNLESVQGDERDVIILSIGYGPTEPGATSISMNFGPLNREGGERRLNVAITRATTELLLFASFDSSFIDLSRTQARAVKHLKTFFEFAERGPVALAQKAEADFGVDTFDSDFEEAVAFKLREKGWVVQTQVGVGKFRIDLGIVHPEKPGVFLAGVECDGATYHGSPAARDRDRVRQIVLEALGWTIVRLWSTDYFIDPEGSMTKLDQKLNALLEAYEESAEVDEKLEESTSVSVDDENVLILDKTRFYDDDYRSTLLEVVESILEEFDGLALLELADEINRRFGIARTSTAQLKHIHQVLRRKCGISRKNRKNPTVWLVKENVSDRIAWRGMHRHAVPRDWAKIGQEERLGLAEAALRTNPAEPIEEMKKLTGMKRLGNNLQSDFSALLAAVESLMKPSQ
ncbi:MAG: DUF4011 domain-containing protein [Pseudomonadales bacterium]|nr:DUF4011 domain-containing protein [Pseudomonadales bacterium]MBO6594606.1 DUF4011 domain-containing protein [Pseudomonadales bacterium]MBO6821833.1 DUF4011 domain-containing protein [Pseudomonadales bacterium]